MFGSFPANIELFSKGKIILKITHNGAESMMKTLILHLHFDFVVLPESEKENPK